MIQISTSVKKTTEVVAFMPPALTLTAASLVPVNQDSPEMDSPAVVPVQVNRKIFERYGKVQRPPVVDVLQPSVIQPTSNIIQI